MRLAIFTHVLHQTNDGGYSGYAPYIREMNLWLQHVDEVEVVAPAPQPPKGEFSAKESYQHSHFNFTKIPSFALLDFTSSVKAVFRIPLIIFKIAGAMKRADHLHIRCPGNIGLLAAICQIFFPNKQKTAKYAGNWDSAAKQPWSYKLQRWILSNTFITRNMKVLVYGNWPGKSKNILPFFTASFSENEIKKTEKDLSLSYKFLFVGNLVPGKQPLFALHLIEALKEKHINAELHVYGDGPLKYNLEKEAANKDYIHLHGNQTLEVLKQAYKDSHFLVLASKSEGWPKAVAEAMFFGCIPIASAVSCVPQMLNYGSRGILIPGIEQRVEKREKTENNTEDRGQRTVDSRDGLKVLNNQYVIRDTVERIIELIQDPDEMNRMSQEAQEWSQEYTLEKFETEIKKLLVSKRR